MVTREDSILQHGIKPPPQLSDDVIKDRILRYVPMKLRDTSDWKSHLVPRGIEVEVIDSMVESAVNCGKTRNLRAYISPGSDGSSEYRLAIDVKIEPTARVTYRTNWRDYVKTGWTKYAGVWSITQNSISLDDVTELRETRSAKAITKTPQR